MQERSRQLERQQSLRVEIEDTLTPPPLPPYRLTLIDSITDAACVESSPLNEFIEDTAQDFLDSEEFSQLINDSIAYIAPTLEQGIPNGLIDVAISKAGLTGFFASSARFLLFQVPYEALNE